MSVSFPTIFVVSIPQVLQFTPETDLIQLSTPRPLADVIAQFTVNVHVENNECIGQMVPLQELSEKLNIFDKPVVAITGPRGIG